MTVGDLRIAGGSSSLGLDVELRPEVFWQKLGAVMQLVAWLAAIAVPVALLRGGPEALLAAIGASLTLHALGYVLRHTVQHLVVPPNARIVRSEQRVGAWRVPFTARAVDVTTRGAIVVVRDREPAGSDGPQWMFVVRAVPDARGSHSTAVFSTFDQTEALQVASLLGKTLDVPAHDRTVENEQSR
jgi:hypothetical protein